jgi:hypothetical protein
LEHYNGSSWSVVSGVSLLSGGILSGVLDFSASNVWAVGEDFSTAHALIEHYDGSAWSLVSSPDPPAGDAYALSSIAASSASNIWVAGAMIDSSDNFTTLTEHWDGTSWTVEPSPNVSGVDNQLNGIAVAGTNDVLAVGTTRASSTMGLLMEHWNGSSWNLISTPGPSNGLFQAAATFPGTNHYWMTGWGNGAGSLAILAERWNGTAPYVVALPSLFGSVNGVVAVSSSSVIGVGDVDNQSGVAQTFVVQYVPQKGLHC